tara:strand:+ start:73 stop:534 length:462 start_codon:yes stop_codon:yes gene_type:complete
MDQEEHNPRRYSFSEVVHGILTVSIVILVLQSFLEVFVHGKSYNHYCCCNLDKMENLSNNLRVNPFNENSFCVFYNHTRDSTKLFVGKNQVESVIVNFREKLKFSVIEFEWYLALKNIPLYIQPDFHCYNTLSRLNLEKRALNYGCVDLGIQV